MSMTIDDYTDDVASFQSPLNETSYAKADICSDINIKSVAAAALARINAVLTHWLPGGKRKGREYWALNPRRDDKSPGSFSVSTDTGQWNDFASGDQGGNLISLGV